MQTLKFKYTALDEDKQLIYKYQRQYSNCLHYLYNRIYDSKGKVTEVELRKYKDKINNIDLIDAYLFQCAVKEANQIYKSNEDTKVIFGGKKNFFDRVKNKISKEEFKYNTISGIYSIGEADKIANRKFRLQSDLTTVIFQPNKDTKIYLTIQPFYNRKKHLKALYDAQCAHSTPITYKLTQDYIYISFYEQAIEVQNYKGIDNRIFAIDLNPNYIGYSIIDWKSSSDFNIIDKGVYSIKDLNDIHFNLKREKLPSTDPKRKYVNNKRQYEVVQVVEDMIAKCIHFRCNQFVMEDLNIKSGDKKKGKHYNSLCNNLWCRNMLEYQIEKRCIMNNIILTKVKAEYSSFVGNFIFRDLNLPDMVLASIELSRRGYEYYNQYKIKKLEKRNNIIFLDIADFRQNYTKSLEEFSIREFALLKELSLKEIYDILKKRNIKYRVPLDENLMSCRLLNYHSLISVFSL